MNEGRKEKEKGMNGRKEKGRNDTTEAMLKMRIGSELLKFLKWPTLHIILIKIGYKDSVTKIQ